MNHLISFSRTLNDTISIYYKVITQADAFSSAEVLFSYC